MIQRRKNEPCPECRKLGNDRAGDNLVTFPDGGKHCFSCQHHIPASGIARRMAVRVTDEPKALLPSDFTREVPTTAYKWLLQYGMSWQYWKDQVGYSPKEERLVFLVGSPTQFSIGRYVGLRSGKDAPRKWYVWGDSHKHCEAIEPRGEPCSSTIVLVEDLVSAHKVACAGFTAVPLFGTEVHPCHKYFLMNENRPVVFWLDWDQAGTIMRKAMGLQSLLGVSVGVLTTKNDPKKYTCEEIKEMVA